MPPGPQSGPHSMPPGPQSGPHSMPPGPQSGPHSMPPGPQSGPHSMPPGPQSGPHSMPPPLSPRGPGGNPYGSYVDSGPTSATGSHAARYPEDSTRTDGAYGNYSAGTGAGYPGPPPFSQPAAPEPTGNLPGQDNGWHAAPPPAAPDLAEPTGHYLYPGGSGYPDAAGYGAGLPPAVTSHQPGYAEPAGYADPTSYVEPTGYAEPAGYAGDAYNGTRYADGYSTDPYDPDAYGGYRPRQA